MVIKGILFDLYGTLINIETDEGMDEIYRTIAHFLTYHGIFIHRAEVRDHYYRILKAQKAVSQEKYSEIDVLSIWSDFLKEQGVKSAQARRLLALNLARLYRGCSRKGMKLYPGVTETLESFRGCYKMALVSDAQSCYALPEMKAMGLDGFFDPMVISSNYGFRKPDGRMIKTALRGMKLKSEEVVFVGNDMYRDMYGASLMGIRTIFFASNQGERAYEGIAPDYRIDRFPDVTAGIDFLTERD